MTIQEAVEALEEEMELLKEEGDQAEWPEALALAEALDMAIEALREKQQREDDGR